jgi:hypothetical protein
MKSNKMVVDDGGGGYSANELDWKATLLFTG